MGLGTHDEYYQKLKHEARERLARIVDEPLAETCREVVEQLEEAVRHGSPEEFAEAVIAVIDVRMAHHELKENHTGDGVLTK